MIGGLESNRPSDVLAGLQDVAQIEIAVMEARGADANEAELRAVNGATCIGRCSQPLGEHGLFDARRYPRLADGRLAGVDGTDLLRGYIDRYNLVAFLRHAGGQNRADISDAEDADLHQDAPELE